MKGLEMINIKKILSLALLAFALSATAVQPVVKKAEDVFKKCDDDKKHERIVVKPQVFNIKQVRKCITQKENKKSSSEVQQVSQVQVYNLQGANQERFKGKGFAAGNCNKVHLHHRHVWVSAQQSW